MSADVERWDPPNDPTAFESLCLDLWRDIWQDHAQKNGRRGQPQAGVDVFGRCQGMWIGVQCKQKDGLRPRSRVTIKELDEEAAAARQFRPPLSTFILATTGPRDDAPLYWPRLAAMLGPQEASPADLRSNEPPLAPEIRDRMERARIARQRHDFALAQQLWDEVEAIAGHSSDPRISIRARWRRCIFSCGTTATQMKL
jgi:hypothetical protein